MLKNGLESKIAPERCSAKSERFGPIPLWDKDVWQPFKRCVRRGCWCEAISWYGLRHHGRRAHCPHSSASAVTCVGRLRWSVYLVANAGRRRMSDHLRPDLQRADGLLSRAL